MEAGGRNRKYYYIEGSLRRLGRLGLPAWLAGLYHEQCPNPFEPDMHTEKAKPTYSFDEVILIRAYTHTSGNANTKAAFDAQVSLLLIES